MVRTSLKAGLAGLALSTAAVLFAGNVSAAPAPAQGQSLVDRIAAGEASVAKLENEVISTRVALDEAKSIKPVDPEAVACAKDANEAAKAKLAAARKQLKSDRKAMAKAGSDGPRIAALGV